MTFDHTQCHSPILAVSALKVLKSQLRGSLRDISLKSDQKVTHTQTHSHTFSRSHAHTHTKTITKHTVNSKSTFFPVSPSSLYFLLPLLVWFFFFFFFFTLPNTFNLALRLACSVCVSKPTVILKFLHPACLSVEKQQSSTDSSYPQSSWAEEVSGTVKTATEKNKRWWISTQAKMQTTIVQYQQLSQPLSSQTFVIFLERCTMVSLYLYI